MKIPHTGLLGIKIAENIPLKVTKNILEHVYLFSMVFISWYKKYFKEKTHDIILSIYAVQENKLLAIALGKFLTSFLRFRQNIEQDMTGEQVMFSE